MADNVEGLVIEIEAQAEGAVSELDRLNAELESLKKIISSSASLATFSKNFKLFSESFKVDNSVSNLSQYANAIEKISAMSNFKLNKSGIKNLDYMAESANKLGGEPLSNLERFAIAMEKLSSMNGFKLNKSVVNNLNGISELSKTLDPSSIQNLDAFTSALSRLSVLADVDTKSVKELATSLKTFSSATRGATSRGRTFNTVLANIRTKTIAMYAALTRVARAMTKSMSVYGDYVEALNLYKMAMGEAAEEGYAFAETAQTLLGIDLTQWMQAQGVFMALAKGFGVANDKAALMSQNLTQLAYDISSFYNISVEDAIQKVQSGFAGQIRPVRNLGYDLSQARLEAIALANGIDEEVKSMTQAEKSQLRYVALMTQLTEVQGDLARTLDSPTNQLRLLNAQIDQMLRSIGMTLLPILNKLIPYLNAIFRVIKMIAEEIAAMFGYTLPKISGEWSSNVSIGADELEEDLEDANGAAEKLKNTLASFDQINLITSKSGGGSGSGSSVGGSDLGIDLPSYDFLGDVNENKAQEIADNMMRALRDPIDFIEKTIMWTYDHIDEIKDLITTLAVVAIGKSLIDNVKEAKKWFGELNDTVKGIGFITIGLQLAWLGGKDIAQGDVFSGFIKSTLGSAALGYGMSLLFGPLGWVLGIGVGIEMTYEGYKAEKLEQMREKINNDFMTLFPDQMKISDLVDAWNHELEKIFEFNADDKNSTANKLKEDVNEIGTAITELHANYVAGTITGAAYANNLEVMYADMEESVKKHLEAVGQAIDEYLDGPFGRWMQKNGEDIQGVKDNVDRVLNSVAENLEKNSNALSELNRKYEEGEITEKEYVKQSEGFIDAMSREYELLGLNTEATTGFIDNFKNLDLNFEDWDILQTKLEEIKQGYEDAGDSIEENRIALKQHFATMRDEDVPEMRSYWEGLIEEADNFADEQKKVLDANYRDILESVESSAGVSWDYVFNKDGLEDALKFAGGHMNDLEDMISEMYSDASLTRNKSYWSELMESIGDYARVASSNLGQRFDFSELSVKAKEAVDDIRSHYEIKGRETNNVWEKTWDRMYTTATKAYAKTNQAEKTYATESTVLYAAWGYNYDVITKRTYDDALKVVDSFKLKQKSSMQSAMSAVQQVVASSDAPEEMKRIMAKMNDAIKPEEFGLKGTSLKDKFMTGFKKDFTPVQTVNDFKDTLSRMLDGDDAKEWGVRIGDSIKTGMTTGLSGAETGVTYALNGAKQVLDQFGSASAAYWSQMSKNIATVMSAIVANPTNPALKSTLSLMLSGMKWTMKGFAKGGFPDSADFFYANENGVPEYIGTMGGRTAVANNAEITKGVADAVYKAIKDTGIANDVKKIASKDGKVVFAPSEEAGRVMSQSVNMYNATGGRY